MERAQGLFFSFFFLDEPVFCASRESETGHIYSFWGWILCPERLKSVFRGRIQRWHSAVWLQSELISDLFCSLNKTERHFMASIPIIQTRIKDGPPKLMAAGWMLAASFPCCLSRTCPPGAWMSFYGPPIIQTVTAVTLCCGPQKAHCALSAPVQEILIFVSVSSLLNMII